MNKITVSVVGASGYAGGELLRLLLFHPFVEIKQVTSESNVGKLISKVHPNLRKITDIKFCSVAEIEKCDLLFLSMPHGHSMKKIEYFQSFADKIIDLSADFRLNDANEYKRWYHEDHTNPEMLNKFVYGIPELHREEMRTANLISSAGCNATATILGLYPLFKNNVVDSNMPIITEVKVGSSEAGNKSNAGSHHPIRSGAVRSFMPTAHRHTAEVIQEISFGREYNFNFSATAIDMIRGVLATSHIFLTENLDEKEIWKIYRKEYGNEPFIRIIKEKEGNYRYPEPKLLNGTNYCDVGFEKDPTSNRLVVISSIDNLMKGAAGQALQAFNIMYGFNERLGLEFPGLHPI